MKISVIICTHNPREDYLERTLDALKNQTFPREEWELLLIDNASKEPLSEKWDLSWHPNFRHILVEELGLTPARLRGIKESKGEILVFVDDDNILKNNYLEKSIEILDENPKLGSIGAGVIAPDFEKEPEAHLIKYCDCLALRVIPKAEWSNMPEKAYRPYGAGLVVQRKVAIKYLESVIESSFKLKLDRKGDNLLSGGDDEFSFVACQMGFGIGVFPELQIIHLISKKRIELHYLLKITEGHGYSHVLFYTAHGYETPKYHTVSNLSDVILNALMLKLSTAICHLNIWWFSRHANEFEKLFRDAWSFGVRKALNDIKKT